MGCYATIKTIQAKMYLMKLTKHYNPIKRVVSQKYYFDGKELKSNPKRNVSLLSKVIIISGE